MMIFFMPGQLAKLSHADMQTVKNMKLLEPTQSKKTSRTGFSLKFDSAKVKFSTTLFAQKIHVSETYTLIFWYFAHQNNKHAEREDRTGDEEESWALSRFYPKLEVCLTYVMTLLKHELQNPWVLSILSNGSYNIDTHWNIDVTSIVWCHLSLELEWYPSICILSKIILGWLV